MDSSSFVFTQVLDTTYTAEVELDSGAYSLCYSTRGLAGPFALQVGVSLTVVPAATNLSISEIVPDRVVAGQEAFVEFVGADVSAFSYLWIVNDNCSGSVMWSSGLVNQTNTIPVVLAHPGEYKLCYSTQGPNRHANAVLQTSIVVTSIPQAESTSVIAATPDRAPRYFTFNVSLDLHEQLYSMFSFIAYTRAGSCAEAANRSICDIADECTVQLTAQPWSSVSFRAQGDFVLCFSTGGAAGQYFEQSVGHINIFEGANSTSITSVDPFRITFGVPTSVAVDGAEHSIFSFLGFAVGDCSSIVQLVPLSPPGPWTITATGSSVTSVCYSTSGSEGPFFLQGLVTFHVLLPASSGSITAVLPGRIASQHTVSVLFVGADFSDVAEVRLSKIGDCNAPNATIALDSGVGSQASAVNARLEDPGEYSICYSTNPGQWSLQAGATLTVVPAAVSKSIRAISVCAGGVCTEGTTVRIPATGTFDVTFLGVDYSNNTRVAFSQYLHPWLGRPDCSSGR
eukprot:2684907-Rhodomonas_salina.1